MLGDSEIEHLDARDRPFARRQKKVRRFDVAMNDPGRVGGGEAERRLHQDVGGVGEREPAFAPEPRGERLALEPFEDEVRRAIRELLDVEQLGDVGALEAARRLRFAQEAERALVGLRARAKELERDLAAEPHVVGGEDDPHPAFAEHAFDAVFAADDHARQKDGGLARRRARLGDRDGRPLEVASFGVGRLAVSFCAHRRAPRV